MPDNNPYSEYSSPALYDDGTGRGAAINPPFSKPNDAVGNMKTLSPAQLLKKAKKKKEVQEEGVDHLEALFDGEDLSEEFKEKAITIFEAAINERVTFLESHILQAAKEIIQEQQQAAKEVVLEAQQAAKEVVLEAKQATKEVVFESTAGTSEALINQIDNYLNYVISEWMTENKVAVERGLRTEIAENFIHGLKDLFESSFIDVPNEKYNVLDDLYDANEELQENVNNLIRQNVALKNEVNAHLCAEAFMQQAQGLADTQVEKLAKLAEGIEFENPQQYSQKVALLRESYFGNGKTQSRGASRQAMLTEDSYDSYVGTSDTSDPMMQSVVNTISLLQKNKPMIEKVIPDQNQKLASLINPNIVKDNFI
jgi:hypothetical protein